MQQKKCPNRDYFSIILQYYLYKKCQKIKKFLIWSEVGGQQISKMSEIQKSLKFLMGGVKPILDFSQIFPFFYNGSPQTLVLYKNDFAH